MSPRHVAFIKSKPVTESAQHGPLADQLLFSTLIVNQSHRVLTVITRWGLRYTVPPASNVTWENKRRILIRTGFRMDHEVSVDMNPTDDEFAREGSMAERLRAAITRDARQSYRSNADRESSVYAEISYQTLVDNDGTVYVEDLDLVLSYHTGGKLMHPFSQATVRQEMLDRAKARTGVSLDYYIVDNKGYYAPRYVKVMGRVIKIPTILLPSAEDGFYAVEPKALTKDVQSHEYGVSHMSMEDADNRYTLFKSPEEAETFGFSRESLERANLQTKHELISIEAEQSITERRLKENDRSFKETELRQREREANRKEIIDLLKFVTGTVITVTGFVVAVLKMRGTGPTK